MSALLEFQDVTVVYGGVTALSKVSMTAEAATIHGLIGPNGAGKSTLFNVASGLVRPRQGAVLLEATTSPSSARTGGPDCAWPAPSSSWNCSAC